MRERKGFLIQPRIGRMGSMEQIEFVIFPDGRVEEKVTGVKGKNVRTYF